SHILHEYFKYFPPDAVFMRIQMNMLLFFFQGLIIYASTRRGGVAEWSCSGLQLRGRRFDSDLRLHLVKARVVKSVDTGDLKSPAHKACQFESGLGHHFNPC